jgi:hypothetical protein
MAGIWGGKKDKIPASGYGSNMGTVGKKNGKTSTTTTQPPKGFKSGMDKAKEGNRQKKKEYSDLDAFFEGGG